MQPHIITVMSVRSPTIPIAPPRAAISGSRRLRQPGPRGDGPLHARLQRRPHRRDSIRPCPVSPRLWCSPSLHLPQRRSRSSSRRQKVRRRSHSADPSRQPARRDLVVTRRGAKIPERGGVSQQLGDDLAQRARHRQVPGRSVSDATVGSLGSRWVGRRAGSVPKVRTKPRSGGSQNNDGTPRDDVSRGSEGWTGWDLNPRPPPCHGGALPGCATGPSHTAEGVRRRSVATPGIRREPRHPAAQAPRE